MFRITHNKTPHEVKGTGLLRVKQLKLSDPQTQVCYVTATPDDLRPDIFVGSLPTVSAVMGKGTPTMPFFWTSICIPQQLPSTRVRRGSVLSHENK